MKIGVLYNRDIHALGALSMLLPAWSTHRVALFHSQRVGAASGEHPPALMALQEYEGAVESLLPKVTADHTDTCLNHINTEAGLNTLNAFKADLLVSIRFGKILRQPAINSARLGVINLHSGLLPDYRGVMPTFWSMLAGATEIGTTLHWIVDPSIDTGPTIAITRQPLHRELSYTEQVSSLYKQGVQEIISAVEKLEQGNQPAIKPPAQHPGAYYSFPDANQCGRFEANGWRWLPD